MFSLCVGLCTIGILSQSCQKESSVEKEYLDPVVLNSPELAEYIIAGAEYKDAMRIFMQEMHKINFAKLEFVKNSEGKEVAYLPISVNIGDKILQLNKKKDLLYAQYPQFAFLTIDAKNEYFQECIRNSVPVNSRLLELGIDPNQPMTKSSSNELLISTGRIDSIMEFLSNWTNNSFNEVTVVVFSDGSAMYYSTSADSPTGCKTPEMQKVDGKYYYQGKQVKELIHSQPDTWDPSQDDIDAKEDGLLYSTYYNGMFQRY